MHTSRGIGVALVAAAIAVGTGGRPASAQSQTQPQAAGTELEEVVVTARKRDEAFRDVPITVNVFTSQEIQSAGITEPRDFIAKIPNVTMVEVQNVGNSFITVRGISQARNSEPSVAVVVDGVLETNPYEFNQELFDVRQIEFLKGPQGALYGRNAIGGAIIISTPDPSDHFEGSSRVGVGNGLAESASLMLTGPVDSAGTLRFRSSFNFYNTDGYLQNVYLDRKADPYRDYTGRFRLLWKPLDNVSADLRVLLDRVQTTAYYYIIPRTTESNIFSSGAVSDANDVTSPIQTNNLGSDDRDVRNGVLKVDIGVPDAGTWTLTTDYDQSKEIDTGDAFDFRPVNTSLVYVATGGVPGGVVNPNAFPFDESQSQFIYQRAWSQEVRFTSLASGGFSWIGGAYFIHTDRFISTGNLIDRGVGAPPRVYYTPIGPGPFGFVNNTNATFLADLQHQHAFALYGDATWDMSKQWELDAAVRYDSDTRRNQTDTPQAFLPDPAATTGEVRKHTWEAWQPKVTVRYKPADNMTVYGGWSRGFRSGGFNQTGVGAIAAKEGLLGVGDLFNAEIADTVEFGLKSQFADRRVSVDADVFHTHSQNGYFFQYDPATSTQNLGNLNATYKGAELSVTARPVDRLNLYASFGYTDGTITKMANPAVLGNKPPLLTRDTAQFGGEYRQPLGGLTGTLRLDYNYIGRTWWDTGAVKDANGQQVSRDPVSLVDLRAGLEGERWVASLWSKNLTNKIYNAEFSPGGFLWRALPRRYGVDFTYKF